MGGQKFHLNKIFQDLLVGSPDGSEMAGGGGLPGGDGWRRRARPSLGSTCRAGLGGSGGFRRLLEVDDGPAVVPRPVREDLDGLDEGPAEVGEAVLDLPRRFGMAFDQAVLLEPAQRLGEDLARDAA